MENNDKLLTALQRYIQQKGYSSYTLKAVFFDMDGVLFDSMPFHAEAWKHVMNLHNIPFDLYDAYLHEGRTGTDTINNFFLKYKGRKASDTEIAKIYSEKSKYFSEIYKIKRIIGISDLMKKVKNAGLQSYLVTGSGQKSLINTLDEWFPGFFVKERMITAYDVAHGKPDPEPYLAALCRSRLDRNQVLVVENAPLGIRAAVDAGLFTVAVNTGILDDEVLEHELNSSGILYHSMDELSVSLSALPDEIIL